MKEQDELIRIRVILEVGQCPHCQADLEENSVWIINRDQITYEVLVDCSECGYRIWASANLILGQVEIINTQEPKGPAISQTDVIEIVEFLNGGFDGDFKQLFAERQ